MSKKPTPALDELKESMRANGVAADPMRIASLVLCIHRNCLESGQLTDWIGQLAIDSLAEQQALAHW